MSSTRQAALLPGHGPAAPRGQRRAHDLYPTPIEVCRAVLRLLVDLVILEDRASIIEPHVGRGDWVLALDQVAAEYGHRYRVTVHDLDPAVPGLDLTVSRLALEVLPSGDWLETAPALVGRRQWDLAVGNPPYAIVPPGRTRGKVVAHDHVQATRRVAKWTCFVLRDGLWTSSTDPDRMAWAVQQQPEYRVELAPRPSFTGDGRRGQFGSVAAVWLQRDRGRLWTQSLVLPWQDRGRPRGGACSR